MEKTIEPKFTIYDTTNCRNHSAGKPVLSVSKKAGTITVTSALANKVNLQLPTKMIVLFDESQNQWFVAFGDYDKGFNIRQATGSKSTYFCNSSFLVKMLIAASSKPDESKVRFLVGDCDPDLGYWPIITNSAH